MMRKNDKHAKDSDTAIRAEKAGPTRSPPTPIFSKIAFTLRKEFSRRNVMIDTQAKRK
jgi:hypothetical protein